MPLPRLPAKPLFSIVSEPDESKEDFLSRVGPMLRAFSDKTGYEACSPIGKKDNRYALDVITNESHVGCAIHTAGLPDGFKYIGETLHSHGNDTRVKPNSADMVFLGLSPSDRGQMVGGQFTDQFSDTDYSGPPGYLAGPNGLLLYHDNDKVTIVKPKQAVSSNTN